MTSVDECHPHGHDDDATYDDRSSRLSQLASRYRAQSRMPHSYRVMPLRVPTRPLHSQVFYGWLWKRASFLKTWKQYFFLLHGCTLTYYDHSCVVETHQFGRQCLDIPARGGLRVATAVPSNATTFGIQITSTSGTVVFVQAGGLEPRQQWVAALQAAQRKKLLKRATTSASFSTVSSSEESSQGALASTSTASAYTFSSSFAHQPVSNSASSPSEGDELTGWLYVRTSKFGTSKRRFVSLHDGHVTVMTIGRGPRRRERHHTHELVAVLPWPGHVLGLRLQLGHQKEFHLYMESLEHLREWRDALRNAL